MPLQKRHNFCDLIAVQLIVLCDADVSALDDLTSGPAQTGKRPSVISVFFQSGFGTKGGGWGSSVSELKNNKVSDVAICIACRVGVSSTSE